MQLEASKQPQVIGDEEQDRDLYLIYSLGGELYGSPIVTIREVVKVQDIKPVPYMAACFRGITNLRGLVLGVMDLRDKFGFSKPQRTQELMLVMQSGGDNLGVIVDDVMRVHRFSGESIEKKQLVRTQIPAKFFIGVGSADDRLVNLIDLAATLDAEDFATIKTARESA